MPLPAAAVRHIRLRAIKAPFCIQPQLTGAGKHCKIIKPDPAVPGYVNANLRLRFKHAGVSLIA